MIEQLKDTLQKMKIMDAYTKGRKIEYRHKSMDAKWCIADFPVWDWGAYEYRIIEAKPKYGPFTFKEACDHLGETIITTDDDGESMTATLITSVHLYPDGEVMIAGTDAQTLLDEYRFLHSGKPCGVEEE